MMLVLKSSGNRKFGRMYHNARYYFVVKFLIVREAIKQVIPVTGDRLRKRIRMNLCGNS
jgi:hypothetical protein